MTENCDPAVADRLAAAKEISHEAARLALDYFNDRAHLAVKVKGRNDVVSEADTAVEALIRERLSTAFPKDAILGEEGGFTAGEGGVWVVDPIDGTAPFVSGIPAWSISIAYVSGGEIRLGAVAEPCVDALYLAAQGQGATRNGAPLRVSDATRLTDGATGLGYSFRSPLEPLESVLRGLVAEGGMYFRNGSGALCLAYVATGGLLGYYEPHINSWDCLGGLILVQEAGGRINDFLAGDGLRSGNPILAAAPGVAGALTTISGIALMAKR